MGKHLTGGLKRWFDPPFINRRPTSDQVAAEAITGTWSPINQIRGGSSANPPGFYSGPASGYPPTGPPIPKATLCELVLPSPTRASLPLIYPPRWSGHVLCPQRVCGQVGVPAHRICMGRVYFFVPRLAAILKRAPRPKNHRIFPNLLSVSSVDLAESGANLGLGSRTAPRRRRPPLPEAWGGVPRTWGLGKTAPRPPRRRAVSCAGVRPRRRGGMPGGVGWGGGSPVPRVTIPGARSTARPEEIPAAPAGPSRSRSGSGRSRPYVGEALGETGGRTEVGRARYVTGG
jgi:hypothetical protein